MEELNRKNNQLPPVLDLQVVYRYNKQIQTNRQTNQPKCIHSLHYTKVWLADYTDYAWAFHDFPES